MTHLQLTEVAALLSSTQTQKSSALILPTWMDSQVAASVFQSNLSVDYCRKLRSVHNRTCRKPQAVTTQLATATRCCRVPSGLAFQSDFQSAPCAVALTLNSITPLVDCQYYQLRLHSLPFNVFMRNTTRRTRSPMNRLGKLERLVLTFLKLMIARRVAGRLHGSWE